MNRLLFCRGRKLQANLVASVISRLMRFELQVSLLGREYDEGVHDLVVFNAMISGNVRVGMNHGSISLARAAAAEQLAELEPENSGNGDCFCSVCTPMMVVGKVC
ncbi:unnamed protein product [Brassica rapa subsp. narinosa]